MIPILILAAGASARMAPRDKLLEPVAGEPILRRTARIACAASEMVLVVLPPGRPARGQALSGLPARRVIAHEAAEGMAASLRAGLRDMPEATGVMVLPADMPGFEVDDLTRMIALFAETPTRILRGAAQSGQPGHPAIFPADLWPALMRLTGDEGGRSVIAAHQARVMLVPLPGDRATLDLDTPQDWDDWRRATGG
ncbi:MAG: nucleotidyltransferase family protein [Gemmobacter sp.]